MNKKSTILIDDVIETITFPLMSAVKKSQLGKTIRLSKVLRVRARRVSKQTGQSEAAIIRMALDAGIEAVEKLFRLK